MTSALATSRFVIDEGSETHALNLMIEGMHCPSCVAIIEGALKKQSGVTAARLNADSEHGLSCHAV